MVTWLTWDLETGTNLTVMCVSCCGFLYKVLSVAFSLSRCEVFLLCLVNSRHIQLITYLLSATCCCFRPKSSWSSNQWSVSVVFYSNCVSAEASLWYAQNDSVSRTVIEDKITGDWEVVRITVDWPVLRSCEWCMWKGTRAEQGARCGFSQRHRCRHSTAITRISSVRMMWNWN